MSVYKQLKLNQFVSSFSQLLSGEHIKHIVLKGADYQKYYPQSVLRTSNDADIYVEPDGFNYAFKSLTDMGFEVFENNSNEISLVKKPSFFVELHRTLTGEIEQNNCVFQKMESRALCTDNSRYSLTNEDFYAFSVYHLYKHFVTYGCGIRMFYDVFLLNKKMIFDKKSSDCIFEELDIKEFADTVCSISNVMFNGGKSNDEYNELINFVFESGMFGTLARRQKVEVSESKSYVAGKAVHFKKEFHYTKKNMQKRYKFLKKAPFLLPFAYIHRIANGLLFKRHIIKEQMNDAKTISKNSIEEHNRIMMIAGVKK